MVPNNPQSHVLETYAPHVLEPHGMERASDLTPQIYSRIMFTIGYIINISTMKSCQNSGYMLLPPDLSYVFCTFQHFHILYMALCNFCVHSYSPVHIYNNSKIYSHTQQKHPNYHQTIFSSHENVRMSQEFVHVECLGTLGVQVVENIVKVER